MSIEHFQSLIGAITASLAGRALDRVLADDLNREHGPGSVTYQRLLEACRLGVAEGWMCSREAGGIRYGRVIKPTAVTHGYSVDVVDMERCAGPHHTHPHGEIDLVMPIEGDARFDGAPAGWVVYGPGSAHEPVVSDGRALVLYLLPQGAIEFTAR